MMEETKAVIKIRHLRSSISNVNETEEKLMSDLRAIKIERYRLCCELLAAENNINIGDIVKLPNGRTMVIDRFDFSKNGSLLHARGFMIRKSGGIGGARGVASSFVVLGDGREKKA